MGRHKKGPEVPVFVWFFLLVVAMALLAALLTIRPAVTH